MCFDDDVITNKDLAVELKSFSFKLFFKMSCKAYPNGCIELHKNLFSIRPITESLPFLGSFSPQFTLRTIKSETVFIFAHM